MRPLTLAEVLDIHRAEGKNSFSIQPRAGEFDIEAYDIKSGERIWREVKPNLVTIHLTDRLGGVSDALGTTKVFISPSTKQPHWLNTMYTSTYQGGSVSASTFVRDLATRTWTITGTIPPPSAGVTRNFQTVGVGQYFDYLTRGNSAAIRNVFAATRLSAMKTQDDTQQIVINYRLSWEEGHNV